MKLLFVLILLLGATLPVMGATRPIKIEDLFRFKRLSDPQISPDGKAIACVVADVSLENNTSSSSIWLIPSGGGEPRRLTNTTKKDRHPRWSPDGKYILFDSTRSGDSQVWAIGVDGGEAQQLTGLSTEASTAIWSPDGKYIAFVSVVYPEFSEKPFKESNELNKKKIDEIAKNPVKAKVFTKLFYRHWDSYVEDKRQHLFIMPWNEGKGGEPRDVTPGDRDAYPTSSTFSVGDDFTFSPDSKYLLYTATPERDEAWSTNFEICRVPITGGKVETLTSANPAADGSPRFSPDGTRLAYRAQKRAGFEADRWGLMVVDVDAGGAFKGKPQEMAPDWDRSVNDFVWENAHTLYLTAEDNGGKPIFSIDLNKGKVQQVFTGGVNGSLSVAGKARLLAFTRATMSSPPEVHVARLPAGKAVNVSQANTELLQQLDLPRPESVKVKVDASTQMQMWILYPPGFDPKKRWPLVYLVHGGPQGAWEDGWSYRWNPEVWAAQGYVVAMPNPRGSTGFGQQFTDEISGDWGGKCFDDLMHGMDYLETQPFIDTRRMAAAGASFGGYMMNWFQGNTTRFKTLITHCGVYNFESMYATTEELWFDEWEHGGPPWGPNRKSYEKHSPHRLADKFKTPMLIIHNDLDFRVPVSEGHQLFTTLQRRGIPSKFINFPDEGHWVSKPRNSEYWHQEVFAWLKKYVKPGGK